MLFETQGELLPETMDDVMETIGPLGKKPPPPSKLT
jgi:hypothetical protein